MGAVFGFLSAPSTDDVDRMRSSLSHRDGGSRDHIANAWSSVGTLGRLPHSIAHRRLTTGGHLTVAVVGELFLPEHKRRRADALLECVDRNGVAALDAIAGACSIVVVQRLEPDGPVRLSLVRDGSGARPLYYGSHRGRVFFAVEPKAILATSGFPRRLRMDAVAQYLTYSFQPGPGTMLEDVHEVGLGECVQFEGPSSDGPFAKSVRQTFPFEFEVTAENNDNDDTKWTRLTRDTVSSAIADRLPPPEDPVGIFLSGGLDSSLVTAEVQAQRRLQGATTPTRSFAIHFGEGFANELDYAKEVADAAGTEHTEVCVSPKGFLPRLRSIIAQLDDPIGDPITIPNFELAAHAQEHTDVVFNGEGGDPLFGGPKNLSMLLHRWYGLADEPFAQERAYLRSYRRAYEERERLMTTAAWAAVDEHQALEAPISAFLSADAPAAMLNKLMAINIRLKGASLILPKIDRMLSAHQIAVRSPLFDSRLTRLSFQMPPRMKLRGGVEKWALKRAFEDVVPASVIARPKSGMRVPVHYWFQGELKRYAKKILSKRELERVGIFDPTRVKQLLAYDIEEGRGRFGIKLWMLLTFELWRRIVVDGEGV